MLRTRRKDAGEYDWHERQTEFGRRTIIGGGSLSRINGAVITAIQYIGHAFYRFAFRQDFWTVWWLLGGELFRTREFPGGTSSRFRRRIHSPGGAAREVIDARIAMVFAT